MRKPSYFILSLLILTALTTITVCAAPPRQGGAPGLVLKGISLVPPDPYPDQPNVKLILTFENQGANPVQEVDYRLALWTTGEDAKQFSTVEKTVEFEGGLDPMSSREVETTITAPPQEGDYEMRIYLPEADEPAIKTSLKVESALPPQVGRLFAALGMFIAMMAVMAVGTESVVGALRLVIGMKRQVSAMEAYQKLKAELPGQLVSLGVDQESIKVFTASCEAIEGTLRKARNIEEAYENAKKGHFGKAFSALREIPQLKDAIAKGEQQARDTLERLKGQATLGVLNGFAALRTRLRLSEELATPIQEEIIGQIENLTVETAAGIGKSIFEQVQGLVVGQEGEWTLAWLRSQASAVSTRASSEITARIQGVTDTLTGLGFDPKRVETIETGLRHRLNLAKSRVQLKTDDYILSMQNLLDSVRDLRPDHTKVQQCLQKWGSRVGLVIAALAVLGAFLLGFAQWQPTPRLAILVVGIAGGSLLAYRAWIPTEKVPVITSTTAARVLLEQESKHQQQEAHKGYTLKLISFVVGIFLAYQLRIDALELLSGSIMTAKVIDQINRPIFAAQDIKDALTVGIILTGMAASAGSAFWHDQLDKLQSVKRQSETAAKVIQQARTLGGTTEQ